MPWNNIYLANSPVITSDERVKTEILEFTESELNASKQLAKIIGTFKMLNDIKNNIINIKKHIGVSAQQVISVLEQNNLTPDDYNFIYHENDMFAIRYDELINFIIRGFEERLTRLENNI